MRNLGLTRRCDETRLRRIVQEELLGSGSYLGCRALAKRLLSKHHIYASRKRALMLLNELDPDGVEMRRSHRLNRRVYTNPGPNYCVHLDGYDKLKPYEFHIHAGVDGYSRRVLWLKVGQTNNDPVVVASYFLDYLNDIKGVPVIVRMDRGTENVVIEDIQTSFRWNDNDDLSGEKSVIYGASHSNQRVERWWGSLRSGGGLIQRYGRHGDILHRKLGSHVIQL